MISCYHLKKCFLIAIFCLILAPVQANGPQQNPVVVENPQVRSIFERLVKSIGKNPNDYILEVHETPELNAYATLNKKMVVNTGLVDYLDSEAGLAFVLAHELGHIEKSHVVKGLVRNNLFGLVRAFFFRNSVVASGIDYIHGLHYSRSKEREADYFAEDLITALYCETPGKLEFFEKIASASQEPSKITEYFSTHPLPDSRLDYLHEEIRATGCVL
jgi:predicted Zn-dependent protease